MLTEHRVKTKNAMHHSPSGLGGLDSRWAVLVVKIVMTAATHMKAADTT